MQPTNADDLQIPNLQPRPAREFAIGTPDATSSGDRALKFTTTAMNTGEFPLDLAGIVRQDDESFVAEQCVRWVERACQERREVGRFFFESHVDHFHWHFEAFALYELRRLVNGTVDWSPEGLVADAQKQAFCLVDSERITGGNFFLDRYTAGSPPFYLACAGVLQGISPGWQDIYGAGLSGQEVVIDNVPDGDYALATTLDPETRLYETSDSDNVSVAYVRISNGGTDVTVLD